MASKFFENQDFKELNQEWNDKLKSSGFKDIENFNESTIVRKQIFNPNATLTFTEEYHELCQIILHEFQFKNEVHKRLFELHVEGLSCRQIANVLQTEFNSDGLKKTQVNDTIKKIVRSFKG